MAYIIFIAIVAESMFVYHFLKYRKSTYEKFDYYLNSQSNISKGVVGLTAAANLLLFIALIVFLGGTIIEYLITFFSNI